MIMSCSQGGFIVKRSDSVRIKAMAPYPFNPGLMNLHIRYFRIMIQ